MKTASNASELPRTKDQEKEFRRLMEEGIKHTIDLILKKNPGNRKGWQNVIQSCNRVLDACTDAALSTVGELTASRLQYVKSVPVPASDEFIITEHLLREKYNFGWFGDNSRRLFFGKLIKKVSARVIAIYKLKEYSTNQQIADELGNQAVTSFAYALSLVEKQRNGESGPLLTNGYANLMVVEVEEEGGAKSIWVLAFNWRSGIRFWYVGANPIDYPYEWRGDYQVLSRDSDTM